MRDALLLKCLNSPVWYMNSDEVIATCLSESLEQLITHLADCGYVSSPPECTCSFCSKRLSGEMQHLISLNMTQLQVAKTKKNPNQLTNKHKKPVIFKMWFPIISGHEINLVSYKSMKKHRCTRAKSAIEDKISKSVACLKGK